MLESNVQRVIEESVPGKQVTLAHVIASPITEVYESLGVEDTGAIGILTISPFETAIIAADIAGKSADVTVGFLDRFTGSVLLTGDVQSVEVALGAVVTILKERLDYEVVPLTKT
ncbi:BMC domain-containing protein [Enterococcus sp. DIV0242_7C1]|uniref:Ethanolamine utilization protein EutS n=1 Tax=Candidatus Enterococcus dunnyi TaxID=1834192 RepID=A0A200JDC4_9ENTE|nr:MULTISPECIES: BMC domain-containing protein [unclassified Enterococcus]MBO0471726.1 BMC domain-containing protein [Enterococcus sp. DIV0242_7C1]OUZ34585.1 microcompartments protein [Enterococcus sp. 9D6_DIV0238]